MGTRITPSLTPLPPRSRCALDAHRRFTRFFNVTASGSLTLLDLALLNSGFPVASDSPSGGAILLSSGSLGSEFVNCTFAACRARQGGAVFADAGASFSVEGCTFRENAALEGGDAYAATDAAVAVQGSLFNSSYASLRGGSLFVAGWVFFARPPKGGPPRPAPPQQAQSHPAAARSHLLAPPAPAVRRSGRPRTARWAPRAWATPARSSLRSSQSRTGAAGARACSAAPPFLSPTRPHPAASFCDWERGEGAQSLSRCL